jgi:CHRD domain
MKSKIFGLIAICTIAAMSFIGGSASAATVFIANLTGSQENPATGSSATGVGTFILNDAMTALTYNITVNGIDFNGSQTPANLNDNLVAAHFHAGAAGVNGPVVFGFFGAPFNDTFPNDVVFTPHRP